ncbi:MAG TPA: PAS domain-containing protein [Chryseosolibacter sp.]|nr:PAS domain-containing protein [Chryseosolibacter sp.]
MVEIDRQLKVLILEDCRDDVDLIERELKRGNIHFASRVVNKKNDFVEALRQFEPDIILSDHSMPMFNSIEALKLSKEYQNDRNICVPFILVTGAVSEEFAVLCIKAGADDYILKDRLKRLPASIESALEKARVENERRKVLSQLISNEALMKEAEYLSKMGSWQADLVANKVRWSEGQFRLFGYEPFEFEPTFDRFLGIVHPEDLISLKMHMDALIHHGDSMEHEYRIIDNKGTELTLNSKVVVHRNAAGMAVRLIGFTMDISELCKKTREIESQNKTLKEIAWMQSHEVRGPLARMMGLISLLQDFNDDRMGLNDTLSNIARSAHELDTIIRNIVRKTEQIEK